MSIFDKLKRKSAQKQEMPEALPEALNTTPEKGNVSEETLNNEPDTGEVVKNGAAPNEETTQGMVMGVLSIVQECGNGDIIISGRISGTLHEGDAVYITNCGDDDAPTFLSTIASIIIGKNGRVETATDCVAAIRIQGGMAFKIKEGTVVYSGKPSSEDIRNAYINALGDVFVGFQKLQLSYNDIEKLSLADLAEIWHLFIWHMSKNDNNIDEESRKQYVKKQESLVEAICQKLLAVKEIYCIYSKATGEPYMFSKTIKQENGYMCTPPHILLFTKSMSKIIMSSLSEEIYGVMQIKNGEDGKGIYNFLGSVFYLNGVNEVAIQVHNTTIPAQMLVPKPDYSNIQPGNIPVTNPDVVRWMLLMGQIGTPKGDDAEVIYRLYYGFMARELKKAKLLIPMQHDGQLPKGDKDGNAVLKKDVQIKIATGPGKGERPAVRMFTDWRQLRMAYGEEWSGMVETVENMINKFDCVINAAKFPLAGCYISKDMYEEMKKC